MCNNGLSRSEEVCSENTGSYDSKQFYDIDLLNIQLGSLVRRKAYRGA